MTLYYLKRIFLRVTVFVVSFSQVNISYADESAPVPVEAAPVADLPAPVETSIETPVASEETSVQSETIPESTEQSEETEANEEIDAPIEEITEEPSHEESIFSGLTTSGISSPGDVNSGIQAGAGSVSAITTDSRVLPADIIVIENGTIRIDGTATDVVMKRDDQLQLREITLLGTGVIETNIGVTFIIPDETKIFSPEVTTTEIAPERNEEEVRNTPVQPVAETPAPVISVEEVTPEPVVEIPAVEEVKAPIVETPVVTEEIIESSYEEEINSQESIAGQAAFITEEITVESLDKDDVSMPEPFIVSEKVFSFGIAGQHLVFTKPIEVRVEMDLDDGYLVILRVKHAGDVEYNSRGISSNPDSTCDNEGNISSSEDNATVKDGEVVFYTCGASDFSIGTIDTTFTNVSFNNIVTKILKLSDGNIMAGGAFTTVNGATRRFIARLTSTGLLDQSFNANIHGVGSNVVNTIVEQPDGMIVVGGQFTGAGTYTRNNIMRLTVTGLVDATFNPNANNQIHSLYVQPDGNILIGGTASFTISGISTAPLTRVTSTGILDTTFSSSINQSPVKSILMQPDGKIIAGGMGFIKRSTITGLADASINYGNVNSQVNVVALQQDGGVLFGGIFTAIGGTTRNRLARLTATGLVDSTFDPSVTAMGDGVTSIIIQTGGNILIGGNFSAVAGESRTHIARLTSTGAADPSFTPSLDQWVNTIELDGYAIMAGGNFTLVSGQTRNRFVRFAENNKPTNLTLSGNTFVENASTGAFIGTLIGTDPDNTSDQLTYSLDNFSCALGTGDNAKFAVSGNQLLTNISDYTGAGATICVRVSDPGALFMTGEFSISRTDVDYGGSAVDSSFIINANGFIGSLGKQSNGNIVIGGLFTSLQGMPRSRVASLTQTGLVNSGFTSSMNGSTYEIAIQPDGNILVGGYFTTVGGLGKANHARLTSTGLVDPSYTGNANSEVYALSVQSDGKILVGGNYTAIGGASRNKLARLTSTGLADPTFTFGTMDGVSIKDVEMQPDGKVLVAGYMWTIGGGSRNGIGRLTSTGLFDGTFNANLPFSQVYDFHVQPDGKIILAGDFAGYIKRVTSTGLNDSSFAAPTLTSRAEAIELQADGKILVGGNFATVNGVTRNGLVRLNSDGTVDNSFTAVPSAGALISDIMLDGYTIYFAGNFTSVSGVPTVNVARINSTTFYKPTSVSLSGTSFTEAPVTGIFVGTLSGSDPDHSSDLLTFSLDNASCAYTGDNFKFTISGNQLLTDYLFNAAIQPTATICMRVTDPTNLYATGEFTITLTDADYANGVLDANFVPNGLNNSSVMKILLQTNKQPVLVRQSVEITRLTLTGQVDPSLSGYVDNYALAGAMLPGGNIIIGGHFENYKGNSSIRLANISTTGQLDTAFNANITQSSSTQVSSILVQAGGDIVFAGGFQTVGGLTRNNMARVTSTGLVDSVFHPNLGGLIYDIVEQSDGKILVAGSFSTIGGITKNNIARLSATGLVDRTFTGDASSIVYDIALQPDGKIIVGGNFTSINGTSVNRIARLTTTGLVDPSFSADADAVVNAVALQMDGKIIIGGNFSVVNGVSKNKLARLNSDGSLDSSFTAEPNNTVNTLLFDGYDLYVGGTFTAIGGVSRNRFAKLSARTVNNPTAIALSSTGFIESPVTGIVVGTFTTTDADLGETFTYTFDDTSCANNTGDNNKFIFSGDKLITNYMFNAIIQMTAQICIRSTDAGGGYITGAYTIIINGANYTNGIVDPIFTGNATATVYSIKKQGNNIIVAGTFTTINGFSKLRVARLSASGLVDVTFSGNTNNPLADMDVAADGSVLVAGTFTTINGVSARSYARLSATSGSLYPGYSGAADDEVESIFALPDGSAYIGGRFGSIGSVSRSRFARVTSTGIVDVNFPSVNVGGSNIYDINVQPDGKVLIGGGINFINGSGRNAIARLTSTGLHDITFNANLSNNNPVYDSAILPNGNIIIAGDTWGGTQDYLRLVSTTGLLDSAFTPTLDGIVHVIELQSDGKILIGGDFMTVNGVAKSKIARLHADGTLDTTFTASINSTGTINTMLLDGYDLYVGGIFNSVNGVWSRNLAKLQYRTVTAPTSVYASGGFMSQPVTGFVATTLLTSDADTGDVFTYTYDNTCGVSDDNNKFILSGDQLINNYLFTYPIDTFATVCVKSTDQDSFSVTGFITIPILGSADYSVGDVDPGFTGNVNSTVNAIAVQSDGMVVFGGAFNTVGGITKPNLARVSHTGLVDSGYHSPHTINNDVYTIALKSNDEAIVGGAWNLILLRRLIYVTNTGWVNTGNISSYDNSVHAIIADHNGSSIIGGSFSTPHQAIARVTSTGMTIPTSFPVIGGRIYAMGVQQNSDIIIAGTFMNVSPYVRNNIARLSGSTFQTDALFDPNVIGGDILAVAVQPDDKIIIGGQFTDVGGTSMPYLARLNDDGTLDTSFVPDPINGSVNSIAIQPDGRVLIGGTFTDIGGTPKMYFARLKGDGSLDGTFVADTDAQVKSVVMDGYSILIGGDFTLVNGIPRSRIARISALTVTPPGPISLTNDTIDEGLATGALVGYIEAQSTDIGDTFTYALDTTCSGGAYDNNKFVISGGQLLTNYVFDFAIQSGATVCVKATDQTSLSSTGTLNIIIRYVVPPPAGVALQQLDSINPNAANVVLSFENESDGSILAAGLFTTFGGVARNRIARISATGLLDQNFNPNAGGAVQEVLAQPDGNIILAGAFTTMGGVTRARIARVTSTGQLDPTFNPNVNNVIYSLQRQSDGKILIGGLFTTVGGVVRNRLARLTVTGALDPTFNPNVNNTVTVMRILPNDDILVGGYFTGVGGVLRNRMAKLTSSGLLDLNFNPNINNQLSGMAVQPDGNILIGGLFTTVGGVTRNRLARVTSTGQLDPAFDPNVNGGIRAVTLEPNGNILIGGVFGTVGGISRNRLARLTSSGFVDMAFDPNVNSTVQAIRLHGTGAIMIGGAFTTIGGNIPVTRARIARIGLLPSFCAGAESCGLWLKADSGVTYNSGDGAIDSWANAGLHAVQATQVSGHAKPTYTENQFNFNPGINFDGGSDFLQVTGSYSQYDTSQFMVYRSNRVNGLITTLSNTGSTSGTGTCDQTLYMSGGFFSMSLGSNRIKEVATNPLGRTVISAWKFGTGLNQTFWKNSKQDVNGTVRIGSLTTDINMFIGGGKCAGSNANAFLDGEIAEIIRFRRALDPAEQTVIESYLALKYGIMLDQTTPSDYILSGGYTAWSMTVGAEYSGNIAGIGRDDVTTLYQRKSQSITNNKDIIVEATGNINNKFTLAWAHNSGSMASWSTGDVPANHKRATRVWKFQENNGEIGSVEISIATGGLPNAGVISGNLLMFVDDDTTFANGSTIYTAVLSGDKRVFVANVNSGQYMTFGFSTAQIVSGTVDLWSPSSLTFTQPITRQINPQSLEEEFDANTGYYFAVEDTQGTDNGYTLTLQLSGDLTTGAYTIPAANVQFKSIFSIADLIAGGSNPNVLIDSNANAYQSLDTAKVLMYRAPGPNGGVVGTYGTYLWLKALIPANQQAGNYNATMVVTLIEN